MNGDPDSWDESETNDHVPPCPGFDRMVQENELRIFLYDALRAGFQHEPAEADRAVKGYRASRTEPLPEHPDRSFLLGAAGVAYSRWVSVTDPAIVAVRERAQRVAAIENDIADAKSYLDIEDQAFSHELSLAYLELGTARERLDEAIAAQERSPASELSSTLYNTAYLAGAAATLAELEASENAERVDRGRARDLAEPESAAEDLAVAEAAITLLRENRDRHGYSARDAATARALRSVLDAAEVWDEVASPTPVDQTPRLDSDLRPDRVRSRPGIDDTVLLDAGFAGAVITEQRSGPRQPAGEYQFLTTGPSGRGPLRHVDTVGMGVIAAGDRELRPTRTDVYAELGAEVRQQLIGLTDAVASQREALHTRETQRAATSHTTTTPTVQPRHQRSR